MELNSRNNLLNEEKSSLYKNTNTSVEIADYFKELETQMPEVEKINIDYKTLIFDKKQYDIDKLMVKSSIKKIRNLRGTNTNQSKATKTFETEIVKEELIPE